MIELKGKYNNCKVYTNNIDNETISQLINLLNQEFMKDNTIRIIDNMILRKGSISAQAGEKVIIPMNMRDGSLICIGKGNPDWNYSAPHGAGRILSRSKAKNVIDFKDFEESMRGIYTTSVAPSTIDESPFVYKPMNEIIKNIKETVNIVSCIKPVYNYKAKDDINYVKNKEDIDLSL